MTLRWRVGIQQVAPGLSVSPRSWAAWRHRALRPSAVKAALAVPAPATRPAGQCRASASVTPGSGGVGGGVWGEMAGQLGVGMGIGGEWMGGWVDGAGKKRRPLKLA